MQGGIKYQFFEFLVWFYLEIEHQSPGSLANTQALINKRKRICKIVDFAVPADHRINLKESEKKNKYIDFAKELKKLQNMKVTIVPIVIGALGTVTKGLLKGLEDFVVIHKCFWLQQFWW